MEQTTRGAKTFPATKLSRLMQQVRSAIGSTHKLTYKRSALKAYCHNQTNMPAFLHVLRKFYLNKQRSPEIADVFQITIKLSTIEELLLGTTSFWINKILEMFLCDVDALYTTDELLYISVQMDHRK